MKIFLIVLFIFFSNSHAKEITFLCNISEELENGKPALKKNYEQTPIYLYLDKNEKWFNDVKKKEFIANEKDLTERVSFNFIEQKKNFLFRLFKYQTVKKKSLNLHLSLNSTSLMVI